MIDFSLITRKKEMIESLQKLLRIKSVKGEPQPNMPYGKGVFDALMKVMGLAEKLDFDSVNLYSHIGYVDYGEGDEVFAVLTHLDVMPEGDGWTVPAFDGTVKDGKIYGRGAIDNKGPAIAALYALSAIKEGCVNLNKRVRLIFGCDEESGWSDIAFYKKCNEEVPVMAISPDAEFPIINSEKGLVQLNLSLKKYDAEGGGSELVTLNAGDRVNAVPAYCECLLRSEARVIGELIDIFNEDVPVKIEMEEKEGLLRLFAHGQSAHGSKPEDGLNAASYMIAFLNQLPLKKNYLSDAVYALSQYVGLTTDGSLLGIASEDASGALTLNMGYIKTVSDGVEVGLDIRYPVEKTQGFVVGAVMDKLKDFDLQIAFSLPAHYVPEDSELVTGLKKAYEEIVGEPAHCMAVGGATYARAFPNAVAFGPVFPGQKGTEHQPDEYIEIDSFIKLADIIANAIVMLCSDGANACE